ncbi:MAG TPA: hypothetical protein VMN99_11990 [Anaerolineales bacterium]|nr:hypothetical protein [Anaerolineales bacterium]
MTLAPHDGKLFFALLWKLQYYVNRKQGIHKNISSLEDYADLPTEQKMAARDELWKIPELIESYVQENPDSLPSGDLEIIRKWIGFVKSSFFILRHLKKGSIFIAKDNQVYLVHGIQDPLEEVIPSYALPQMVEAILLPFKGQIIYDGLLAGYSVHFGQGIRSDLEHTYKVAKQKDRIISTLEPELATAPISKPKKNITPQLTEISAALAKLKGDNPLQNSALSLARASIDLSLADAQGTLAIDDIDAHARKIFKTSKRLLDVLDILEEQ